MQQVASGTGKLADGATIAATKGGQLTQGTSAAAAGTGKLAAGAKQLSKIEKVIDTQVHKIVPKAQQKALEKVAKEKNLSVIDGQLAVDYSDPVQRRAIIDEIVPTMIESIKSGDTSKLESSGASSSDTSFLTGADPRLTKPFMVGFNSSVVTIYWVGLGVMLLAFVITWFFKVPPLRERSALQEIADGGDNGQAGAVDVTASGAAGDASEGETQPDGDQRPSATAEGSRA